MKIYKVVSPNQVCFYNRNKLWLELWKSYTVAAETIPNGYIAGAFSSLSPAVVRDRIASLGHGFEFVVYDIPDEEVEEFLEMAESQYADFYEAYFSD